jgi:hypothetical protein
VKSITKLVLFFFVFRLSVSSMCLSAQKEDGFLIKSAASGLFGKKNNKKIISAERKKFNVWFVIFRLQNSNKTLEK